MGRMIDDLRLGQWTSLADGQGYEVGEMRRRLDVSPDWADTLAYAERALADLTRRHDALMPSLMEAVPIVADEVAAYVFAQDRPVAMREEQWDWGRDFPVLAPPFPMTFVEWRQPTEVVAARFGREFLDAFLPREGVLFLGGTKAEAGRCPLPPLARREVDYAHWLTFSAFGEFRIGSLAEMGTTAGVLVDGRGQVVGEPMIRNLNGYGPTDRWSHFFRKVAGVALLTITFMHCKSGVRLVDVEPPERLNRARVRRGRPPLARHKTLVIEGLKELLRREGAVGQVGLKRALHLVRGHFATYTAEKPLLGHFVGTVFRAAHTRGRSQYGTVTKDYEVKAPRQREGKADG
jgi:hypothetical protein